VCLLAEHVDIRTIRLMLGDTDVGGWRATERSERATPSERAGEAASQNACRGARGAKLTCGANERSE
jgi:hypothetical protein